jgi:GTPase
VIRVGVGTVQQTQIPPLELPRYGAERLSGIRCISTQLKPENPTQADLTSMALQRLDMLVILNITGAGFQKRGGGMTGYIKDCFFIHLVPDPAIKWILENTSLDKIAYQDFIEVLDHIETAFQEQFIAQEVDSDHDRVLLIGLKTDHITPRQFDDGLAELIRLVDSAGGEVLQTMIQKRSQPHPQTVVGEGKVQEIALEAQTIGANLIVFNRSLSPSQIRNLEIQIGVRVVDRTEVILDIFAQRAQSRAGKLQVELAQLEYMRPRLIGRGQAMSRLGGGIGTRGPGETKLETERRSIDNRISRLQQEVNQLQAHRARLRQKRQTQEIPSITIVGYTNAGKSTLLNTLTNAEVYAADQLFATLDPTSRRLVIPEIITGNPSTIVITDTVGFIHELPPPLVDAFRATLEEVSDADALLHLVDLSHPAWQSQINSVNTILGELPITPGPALIVFNKIDQVDSETLEIAQTEYPQAVFISAFQRLGLETLRQRLSQLIKQT